MHISSHDHVKAEALIRYASRWLQLAGLPVPQFTYIPRWDAAELNDFECRFKHQIARAINVQLAGLAHSNGIAIAKEHLAPDDLSIVRRALSHEDMEFGRKAIHAASRDPWIASQACASLSMQRVHRMPSQAALESFFDRGPWEPGEIALLGDVAFISHSHGQNEYVAVHAHQGTIGYYGGASAISADPEHLTNYLYGVRMIFDTSELAA